MDTLLQYWQAGGRLMTPLAILCFATWAWGIFLCLRLRSMKPGSRNLEELLQHLSGDSPATRAKEWARKHGGTMGRIVEYVASSEPAARAIRGKCGEARAAELSGFTRDIRVLDAMVAAAPLLGLLGTVMGMIATFSVLSSRGTVETELLSGGISEALVTTQVGLVVALPGLFSAGSARRHLGQLHALLDRIQSHFLSGAMRAPVGHLAGGNT